MPTYRFKCPACGKFLEREYRMSEVPKFHESFCETAGETVQAKLVPYPVQTTFKMADGSAYKGPKKKVPVRRPGEG